MNDQQSVESAALPETKCNEILRRNGVTIDENTFLINVQNGKESLAILDGVVHELF